MKKKLYAALDEVVADIPDGARIMFGGFGGAGFPNNLIQALARKGAKNITAISNNCGTREGELGLMFKNNQIKHVIASFPGPHSNYFQDRFAAKEVTLELVPQGILCERMRAAAAGLQPLACRVSTPPWASAPKSPMEKKSACCRASAASSNCQSRPTMPSSKRSKPMSWGI